MLIATHIIKPHGYEFKGDDITTGCDREAKEPWALFTIQFYSADIGGWLSSQPVEPKYEKEAVAKWNAMFSKAPKEVVYNKGDREWSCE